MTNITSEEFFNAPSFADIMLVKSYIEQGCDVNAVTNGGNNILWHIASSPIPDAHMRSRLIEMAQLLIAHNVSAAALNDVGINAVWEAVGVGFFELCELFQALNIKLTEHVSLNEFIYRWLRHPMRQQRIDFPKVLALLLSEQPDLTQRVEEYRNYTPLQMACNDGKTEAILRLLQAGADANQHLSRYQTQATPLELLCNCAWRAKRECYEAINALLNAGANPNLFSNDIILPNDSKPALIWVVIYGGSTTKVVERLLQAGAQIDLKDACGHDALYWAKQSKRDDLVALLMQYKNKS